jgi:competence protein ComEC
VLGEGGALGYERRKTIAAVGLAHLFAVSGLHIALVSGSLVAALRWLLRGCAVAFDARRLAAALGVPLTLFHAAFAGGSPSAWRAAITAALTWSLVAAGRRPAPAAITAAAALLLSAPDPAMALRPAFLLSIVATSAILSAPRVPHRGIGWRLRIAAIISARTLIATTPMVWWWFGGVPLIGWLTNIVVLPFGTWVVVPLAHLAALSFVAPPLVEPLGAALELSVRALLAACEAFAPLAITRRLPPLDPTQGIVVAGACLLLLWARSWRGRLWVLLVSFLLWLGAEHALRTREQPRGELRVTFADVGQGDSALIDLPDGRFALVDTGRGEPHPSARALRALLAARRRSRIDLLVITHAHPDHYGGLRMLLSEVEVGEIWLNGQWLIEAEDGSFEALLNQALALKTKLRFVTELCGTTRVFGNAELETIWPCPRYDPGLGLNDNSLTLLLRYGHTSFLLTGDLEREAEQHLMQLGRVGAVDVLKVAHHGSATSSTEPFLEAARPSLAVISCGLGNRYGHPNAEVLERLEAVGAEVLRTDHRGGVIVRSDGKRLRVRR